MAVSFNTISTPYTPPQIGDAPDVQQTAKSDKTLVVTVGAGDLGASGAVNTSGLVLSYPLTSVDEMKIGEITKQLENLDLSSLKGMSAGAAALQLNQLVGEVAGDIIQGGKEYVQKNAKELTQFFDKVEKQATQVSNQLFNVINNSTYPDFSKFLGKLLDVAQKLRELASEAKHNLVQAEVNNVLDQAKQMEKAAEENYQSTIKEIDASTKEAIGKLVSGVVSFASIATGGALGKWTGGANKMGFMSGASMFGAPVGNALGGIAEASSQLAGTKDRYEGAAHKKEADLAQAFQKKIEAGQKLIQDAESVTDELKEIAKTLTDTLLKLHADFIASQKEIIQRANI